MEPGKVTEKNAYQIRERLYGHDEPIKPCNLQVGDKVRIPKIKNIHSKGYSQSKYSFHFGIWDDFVCSDWSDSLYTIVNSQNSLNICYYTLENSDGDKLERTFYSDELNFVSRPVNL